MKCIMIIKMSYHGNNRFFLQTRKSAAFVCQYGIRLYIVAGRASVIARIHYVQRNQVLTHIFLLLLLSTCVISNGAKALRKAKVGRTHHRHSK